jgi:hypothetical protein
MKISFEQAENLLRRRMRTNQIIFGVAIAMGVGAFVYYYTRNQSLLYIGLAFYFVCLGALNLPNINKCKSDINDYKKDNLVEVTGKVLDLFPERENEKSSKNWYMFLQTGESGEYVEFTCPEKPEDIGIEKSVKVRYTKLTHLPIEIHPIEGEVIKTDEAIETVEAVEPIKADDVVKADEAIEVEETVKTDEIISEEKAD